MRKNYINFTLILEGVKTDLGSLRWPHNIKSVRDHGFAMEIVDTKGIAVVSLDDITLEDLIK